MKPTSSARRGPGAEEKKGRDGSEDRLDRSKDDRRVNGWRRCNEVDRGGTVMAERKADLAIAVGQDGRRGAGWRQDGRRAARRSLERVMMPTE
jgi:hypothetical protein